MPATRGAFGCLQMRYRNILNEEGDHTAAGGQHHPDSKAYERTLKRYKIAG